MSLDVSQPKRCDSRVGDERQHRVGAAEGDQRGEVKKPAELARRARRRRAALRRARARRRACANRAPGAAARVPPLRPRRGVSVARGAAQQPRAERRPA